MNYKQNIIQMNEIIQDCLTGFGDCVYGYVSMYIFKKIIEKYFIHREIKLYIRWTYCSCPYIRNEYLYNRHLPKRRERSKLMCLYYGTDGVEAFTKYYKSQRMFNDMKKTTLYVTINQYVGKCFIDENVSRDEVAMLTTEAYNYFWYSVLDQEKINSIIKQPSVDYDKLTTLYVRLGDQFIVNKDITYHKPLENCYQLVKDIPKQENIALIGDLPFNALKGKYQELYKENEIIVDLQGEVGHSIKHLTTNEWIKIFTDLNLLLKSKTIAVLTNYSNFPRIVIFLRDNTKQKTYFFKNDKLELVNNLTTIFAKHYDF